MHENLQNRLKAFLSDYCQAYTEMQLDKFAAFFTSDAIEKGKLFHSRLAQYRRNFQTIDSLSYWIELERYSIPQHIGIIQIEGTFEAQAHLTKGSRKWRYSSGKVSMDLVESGDSFKVRRLDYYMQ